MDRNLISKSTATNYPGKPGKRKAEKWEETGNSPATFNKGS